MEKTNKNKIRIMAIMVMTIICAMLYLNLINISDIKGKTKQNEWLIDYEITQKEKGKMRFEVEIENSGFEKKELEKNSSGRVINSRLEDEKGNGIPWDIENKKNNSADDVTFMKENCIEKLALSPGESVKYKWEYKIHSEIKDKKTETSAKIILGNSDDFKITIEGKIKNGEFVINK